MINSEVERGSPCLRPLDDWKEPTEDPLSKIAKFADEIQLEIRLIH